MTAPILPGARRQAEELRSAIVQLMLSEPARSWTPTELHERLLRLGSRDNIRRAMVVLRDRQHVDIVQHASRSREPSYRISIEQEEAG